MALPREIGSRVVAAQPPKLGQNINLTGQNNFSVAQGEAGVIRFHMKGAYAVHFDRMQDEAAFVACYPDELTDG